MKIGIYANVKKTPSKETTLRIIQALNNFSVEISLHKDMKDFYDCEFFDFENFDVDVMFCLGGDGTMLKIAKYCAKKGVPIFGINIGTVGFLTELEPEFIEQAIPKILNGDYYKEKRTLIEVVGEENSIALNDIVLNREYNSRLLLIDLYINDEIVDKYYCDGFIVSTPTGSTAYSLSAGGAIVSPLADVLALTPINSHSLHSRPIVINSSETVSLKIANHIKANVIVDGDVFKTGYVGRIDIKKSDYTVEFIRLDHHNFYNKLLKKLNKWSVVDLEEK